MISPKEVRDFQKKILSWFAKNKRDLPWRKSRDPYNILISEVMLQQTQVPRVIPKYNEWIKKFPTIQSLAKATTRDVLSLWSGLGYNRRALYLQKTAQEIVEKYHGKFPEDEKQLQSLPGIGEYTARAVLCFAFDKQIAVIDTNIKKVIAIHFCKGKVPQKKKLQEIADKILPQGKAYTWNQALMDYASAELKKEKIAIPKQSKFKDSDRYYRGQMLKLLLRKK
ncbi:MAG: A/G-specific adenine glycosylase, partial [Candidatus Levyibacteriota bacterium]